MSESGSESGSKSESESESGGGRTLHQCLCCESE